MSNQKKIFLIKSKIASDKEHRKTIRFNISRYNSAVEKGKRNYVDLETLKNSASDIKESVISNLDKYLEEFEKNISKRGAKVLWAKNSNQAINKIIKILSAENIDFLVKSKSMITEEIGLNEELEKIKINPVETDLGEFIVQQAGEKPYHILTPAMHKSKEDIAKLFHKKFQTEKNATPEELTGFVREKLRKFFSDTQVGITGANFIVSDIGAIGLTENEGNGLMSVSFPKIHIVIAGIEKVIPSINHLELFIPLLAHHGTGQQVTVYNSLLLGPGKKNETDGPEQMYVILLDNKRTSLLEYKNQYKALKCIRCGACLNACPVYKNIGGYTYGSNYSGPIGSIITPFLKGFKEYNHLSFACTVCGKCSDVCPVKIPLHLLLLENRNDTIKKGYGQKDWNTGMKIYKNIFSKRSRLDTINGHNKRALIKIKSDIFGKEKEFPSFSDYSFSNQWKKNSKKNVIKYL